MVLQLFQRNFSKEAWPSLQLPSDESVVAHANPNVVNFYDPADPTAGQSSSSTPAFSNNTAELIDLMTRCRLCPRY
jgi:hypothetical protein